MALKTIKGTAKKLIKPKNRGLRRIVNLRSKDWLVSEIHAYLEKWQGDPAAPHRSYIPPDRPERQSHDRGWFHPSQLPETCDLKLLLDVAGFKVKEHFTGQTLAIFENGHAYHRRMEGWLCGMDILVDAEEPITIPDYRIRGTLDFVVEHPADHRYILIDAKSANDYDFNSVKQKGPPLKYVIQLHPYYYAHGVREGGLLYENKNTQELNYVPVPWNQEIWDEIKAKCQRVMQYAREKRVPRGCGQCHTPDICEQDPFGRPPRGRG